MAVSLNNAYKYIIGWQTRMRPVYIFSPQKKTNTKEKRHVRIMYGKLN